ncbi:pseudaminic acid synthase [Ornithinibacillus scapharcae]|uniref:pseudaminic acid synthase n=1 Tax=Ornithinibacillus scapharcae TaxID=1147159 RepID=UPI000225BFFE|nr:pseudaminic acid synthase [Ornithinibacillus scapharcae]
MNAIKVGNHLIGKDYPPFIVAEMSGNHNQSLDKALEIVEEAAKAGAHAIKIQTYTADTMTLNLDNEEFTINNNSSIWNKKRLYELYQEAHTPWEWHEPIFKRCKALGILAFSSPFDSSAVDFLETLDVPCYKIASFECTDLPLIRRVAQTKKPMIISTGMCSVGEIEEAVMVARNAGCKDIILLKCTSTYPASPVHTNIRTIPHMEELFQCQIGLSDHTMGTGVAVASVALGAVVIEKHLTISRAEGGVDAIFSMEPNELSSLVKETKSAWESLGDVTYGPTSSEKDSLSFRRSLYVVEDMKEGEVFTEKNLKAIRPGYGLPPRYYDVLLGKQIKQDIKRGTPVTWALL